MTQTFLPGTDRTGTYEDGGTFVQWTDDSDAIKIGFATAWTADFNMDDFDVDLIDSAAPIFTKKSDIIGTFSFSLKNLISLYDPDATPSDELLISTMVTNISNGQPVTLKFAPVMKAVSQISNPFLNLIFTGRIMGVPLSQILDQGAQDVEINGVIIGLTQIRREATANEES